MQSARPEKAVPFVFMDYRTAKPLFPWLFGSAESAIYRACRLTSARSKLAAKPPRLAQPY